MSNSPLPTRYLAHSANGDGAGVPELLSTHLRAVAEAASRFGAAFGVAEQAFAAGLVHDLGKYADQFLRRLSDSRERGRDHWSAGAALLAAVGRQLGLIPALAVAGHHRGLGQLLPLPDLAAELRDAFRDRRDDFTEPRTDLLCRRFLADGFQVPKIADGLTPVAQHAAAMLDIRMFFSALVDADFLETEAHFNGDAHTPRRPRPDGPSLDPNQAIAAMEEYLTRVRERHHTAPMATTRESLLRCCVGAATQPMGIYSLAAPTGSGKTLAMLAFALQHAKQHGLRRIVLVMPFLNIIEQTARVYRDVFSPSRGFAPDTVLEHHSLAVHDDGPAEGGSEEDGHVASRLLAENWDAPFVLTTTVQFFESLMASRPARCRKLHRLARSVVLFDEVQTLPLQLAVPTLATLSRLADPAGPYRSTVVFATATQPAFDALHDRVKEFASSGWQPREIVPHSGTLFAEAASRVRISWRHETGVELSDLASELQQHERVLCIVNLKRHAVQLAEALRDRDAHGLFHLSTNMCPAHRTAVLEAVNERLRKGKPVRLVATQCVEAGVDLDFPVVYRALAPLEAIAQAAGRCNRHGTGPSGRVVVFKPRDDRLYPPGYRQAVSATEVFLAGLAQACDLDATEILNNPERLQAYFRQFYTLSGRTAGEQDDEQQLLDALRTGDFAEVSERYKLISQDAIQVLVPYDRAFFDQLCDEISANGWLRPDQRRDWLRRASPHAIGLFRPQANADIWNLLDPVRFTRHPIDDRHSGWYIALRGMEYDPLVGLAPVTENLWIA